MSLKRKASFSAVPPTSLQPRSGNWGMSDDTKHLHSRTRKRFRDGRPSDEVVYEKTLRWIFSAQQKQHHQQSPDLTDPDTEVVDVESILPTPETVDPRQQTLLRFFPLQTQPSSPFRPSREALAPRANETALRQDDFMRRRSFEQMQPPGSLSGSETTSLGYNQVDTDMSMDTDMELDTDQSSDASNLVSKTGIMGCM